MEMLDVPTVILINQFTVLLFCCSLQHKANSNVTEDLFIPSKVKSWAIVDLNRTTTWLESQEEKVGGLKFSG